MKRMLSAAIAAAMAFGLAGTASSATVKKRFDFTASSLTPLGAPESAPSDPVIGSITIEFDPAVTVSRATTGITLNSLNIAQDSDLAFSFDPNFFGLLQIGGIQGSDGVQWGTNDFAFQFFQGASATPQDPLFYYSQTGVNNVFLTRNIALTVTDLTPPGGGGGSGGGGGPDPDPGPVTGGVPEPATWALMIGGFGLAGAALRRRALAA